jgi:hypothetical protein
MNKYSHIKSFKDVDAELIKIDEQKRLIKNQLNQNVEMVRAALTPSTLFWMLAQSLTASEGKNSLPRLLVKIASELLTTVQASKYGLKLIKKLFK